MKKLLSLLLALAMILSLAACGTPAEEGEEVATVTPGKLTVAFSPDYAPMEFVDLTKEGQDMYVGFDVTLAKFIAEQLHLQLVLVPMSFDACQTAVAEGTVDLSISGFSWSAQREQDFNLSDIYHAGNNEDAQVIITLAAHTEKYTTTEGLADAKIGVQRTSLQHDLTLAQLPESQLVVFTHLDDAVAQLLDGHIDCITVADGNADAIIAANPQVAKSGFQFVVTEKQTGNLILLQKGNDELTALVNNILAKAEMYYETWYADARATAGIESSFDHDGNAINP
jgi:polar amino acid transport system substrate-binding protein